jgi:hypothetical protein
MCLLILGLGALFALGAGVASATEPPIVFDRGANLFQLHPLLNLRAPSALYTVVPSDPGGEVTPTAPGGTPPVLPVLVPGTRDGSTNIMGSWFPDRSKIAYVSNRGTDTRAQVWVVDLESGAHTRITTNEANNIAPAVSPDAEQIVYLSTDNPEDFPEEGEEDQELWRLPANLEIYVMNADGTEPRRLTDNDIEEEAPVFSFYGDTIYFLANIASAKKLYSIPVDGKPGDEKPILDATLKPILGNSLGLLGDPLGDILCYNAPSGVYTFLDLFTRMTSTGASGLVRPYPSDDGAEVAYVPGGNLYVAAIDGTEARALVLTGDVTYAQWRSPVGAATPVGLRLDRPNGGEFWPRGQTMDIKWKFSGADAGPVKIQLSHNGIEPKVVVASTPNDGVYEWTIPTDIVPGSDYVITVTLLSDPTVVDTSEAPFSIVLPQDCPKPAQVSGVDASDGLYTDRVQLNWNASANAEKYLVYRNRINSWTSATLLEETEETGFEDTTAIGIVTTTGCRGPQDNKTEYYYWVRAVNDCGTSTPSQTVTGYRGKPVEDRKAVTGDTLVLAGVLVTLALAARKKKN